MMLRWHYYQNDVTAAQVREYAALHETSMNIAKETLKRTTPAKLQISHNGHDWFDVPYVSERHPDA